MTIPRIQGGQPVPILIWNDSDKSYHVWTGSVDATASVTVGAISATIVNSAGWVVDIGNPGDIGGGYQYPTGSGYVLGNSGTFFLTVNSGSGLFAPLYTDTDGALKTTASLNVTALSTTILNSAGWVVNVANTGGVYSMANTSPVYVVSATILNSGGWAIQPISATILNSANWVFSIANTIPSYSISNTSLSYSVSATILNSGGWAINPVSATILNSAGWLVTASATILNSANWVMSIANTGWVIANTALVQIINTSAITIKPISATIVNSGGWIFNLANTGWISANTSLSFITNTAGVMVGNTIGVAVGNSIALIGTAVVTIENHGEIGGGMQYASGSTWVIGNTGNAVWAVNSNTGLYTPFYLDADNNLKTTASVAVGAVSATIVNSAGWVVSIANTGWIEANTALVRIVNPGDIGSSASVSSTILNSAGWVVSVANTMPSYAISNTSISYNVSATIVNSGSWVFAQSNTSGGFMNVSATIVNSAGWFINSSVTVLNSAAWYVIASATIVNSGGWVVSMANTGWIQANTALVQLINTGAFVLGNTIAVGGTSTVLVTNTMGVMVGNTIGVSVVNTAGVVAKQGGYWNVSSTITNSGGWIFAQSNTSGGFMNVSATITNSAGWFINSSVTVLNSANWLVTASATILNSAGWIVSIANTGWVEGNTARTWVTNASQIGGGYQYGQDGQFAKGGTGTLALAVYMNTPRLMVNTESDHTVLITDSQGMLYVNASGDVRTRQLGAWAVSSTITNSAGWIVSVANTGWVVANTALVQLINTSAITIKPISATIVNSGGWIFAQSNTAGGWINTSTTILNSANWVMSVANTGWVIANTALVQIINTSALTLKPVSATILNSAGWIVSIANTGWISADTGMVNVLNQGVSGMVHVTALVLTTSALFLSVAGTNALTIQNQGVSILKIGGLAKFTTLNYGIKLVPNDSYDFGKINPGFSFCMISDSASTVGLNFFG